MEAILIHSIARSIAGKAANKRGDNFIATIEKTTAIIKQIQDFSNRADLPEKNLVLDIKQNSAIAVEYGLIMFVLQNLLDLDLVLDKNFKQTINRILSSVTDVRDHRYRYGQCSCFHCRKSRSSAK
jgi:hypothetical protein